MKRLKSTLLVFGIALLSLSNPYLGAEAEWENLFDGKTLNGWIQRNGKAEYTVEDGMIVGTTVLNTPNSFLCTEKNYTDFILELEFLVEKGMNSGIQIRSQSWKHYKDYRVHGYQVEIDTSDRAWSGGIYDEARRGWLYPLKGKPKAQKAFKQNEWNQYRVEAIGDRIRTWVNGVPAADLRDDMTSTGFIALQVHSSKEEGKKIKWRNIRIQDLTRRNRKQLKALIVDGQNNHNWKGTTPVLKGLLEETGLFAVDVATTPAKGKPMDSFKPDFAKYDVVVSNYTGDQWTEETQDALVDYMKNGGGLVVYHAANNAFPKWKEWNEMIGVGGWGGRDEKSGPKIRYRDGRVVLDHSPGRGGSHGPQHDFQIITRDRTHAITAGLPEKWMHTKDELYSNLRGPAKNVTVLATAYADPKQKGTGEHEPMLMTIRYGKGRVFHTAIGHNVEQLRCIGFITTFQRGAEWAATGRVTRIEVSEDFPTAGKVSLRTNLSADYSAIEEYDFGKSRRALAAIEEEIRTVARSSFAQVEVELLKALDSSKTTFAGKQFVCRMLRRVGSAQSAAALAKLLEDEELSHMARFALQHMPAPQAGAALRKALPQLKGDLKIGVIGSIGQRGDRKAVEQIAKLAADGNANIARSAIDALGRIGGSQAAEALAKIKKPENLKSARDNAYLMCADSMLDAGQKDEALKIYRQMSSADNNTWIRIAAYKGLVQAEKEEAVPIVIALLKDKDLDLQRAAGEFMTEMPGDAVTEALAEQLEDLGTDAKIVLLSALEARGDKTAAPYVAEEVKNDNSDVRLAAVKGLAVLGDASNVKLLTTASVAGDEIGKAAMDSLSRLSGKDVAAALTKVAQSKTKPGIRVNAIQALVNRRQIEAVSALFAVAGDEDDQVRQAAYKALGELSGQDELSQMVSMLLSAKSKADRTAIERAMIATVTRLEKPDAAPVVAALGKAENAAKSQLLAVLPHIGGDAALEAVRNQLDSKDSEVAKAAVRALGNWPHPAPMPDLLEIARKEKDPTRQTLAIRGYIELLGLPANRSSAETVGLLADGMAAAKNSREKKMILGALSRYPCKEALEFAQKCMKDKDISAEAELAFNKIKEFMLKKTLSAKASRNSGDAKNALDGDRGTRWSTGRGMKPGDWFVLDLGTESEVKGLTLDTTASSNDYPRGYEVYVSFDGGDWGKPVTKGEGVKPITEIKFDKPVKTRFIKILQTGSSETWHWSIHELKVDL
jgi:HEAT repeat protein